MEHPVMSGALLTDLYELNMAASYLRHGMCAPATFSLFVRNLPPNRGFLVAAGAESCCEWLEQFGFEDEDLAYLAQLGFDDGTLESFSELHFTGEVVAVPEGRMIFANEPIIEVTAPIAEAQLVETYLLNQVSLQTMLATKAARCRVAAAGKIDLVEFGFRRTQGIEAGIAAARLSAMVGFSATSNVEAARRFGLVAAGTMAHSYIEAFEHEVDAFSTFASDFPNQTTLLVDTYDTLGGVARAIEVIKSHGLAHHSGIRLDSGDLAELSVTARRLLDAAGLLDVRIFVSGGLDEYDLARFVAARSPIDAAGVGTRLGVSADAPYLDSAYKLVAYNGRAVAKLSPGKATLPGPKQIFRGPYLQDAIGCRDEATPAGATALLEEMMQSGRRLRPADTLSAARVRFETDLGELPEAARRLTNPVAPDPEITPRLSRLTEQVRATARRRAGLETGP
jgi:nicotinate phosphoribosyltransferase